MKTLLSPTEDFVKSEQSVLNADASAGSNVSLTLESNDGMARYAFVAIGNEGAENCELEQINVAPTGNAVVQVATLKHAHLKGEPVVVFRYDKRKFYGCTTATGTYAELTTDGSPKLIEVDDPQGTLLEYTGLEGYIYFKSTYYNSQSLEETTIDDSEAVLADETKRYCSIYAIRKQAGLSKNPFITDGDIETYRKRAENEVNSILAAKYVLPLAEVPAIIENACTLLAAGYIDYKEFGKDGEGVKWLGEGRGILNSIKKGTQLLIGIDGAALSFSSTNSQQLRGFPDDSIGDGDSDARQFRIDQQF
jgi:phage gp36-like protein